MVGQYDHKPTPAKITQQIPASIAVVVCEFRLSYETTACDCAGTSFLAADFGVLGRG